MQEEIQKEKLAEEREGEQSLGRAQHASSGQGSSMGHSGPCHEIIYPPY